jgi:hypothetical protein
MLPRQPLRFLLADDPGAGKTIMAGLFCKELMIRGDVERCLVIAPGSLVEQWQEELWQKFALNFEILTKDMTEASRSGNPVPSGRCSSPALITCRATMTCRPNWPPDQGFRCLHAPAGEHWPAAIRG